MVYLSKINTKSWTLSFHEIILQGMTIASGHLNNTLNKACLIVFSSKNRSVLADKIERTMFRAKITLGKLWRRAKARNVSQHTLYGVQHMHIAFYRHADAEHSLGTNCSGNRWLLHNMVANIKYETYRTMSFKRVGDDFDSIKVQKVRVFWAWKLAYTILVYYLSR